MAIIQTKVGQDSTEEQPSVNISDKDWKEAQEHIKELNTYAMDFKGKDGMNPFAYRNEVIIPLLALPKSKVNYEKIMAYQKEEPTTYKFGRNPLTKKTQEDIHRELGVI